MTRCQVIKRRGPFFLRQGVQTTPRNRTYYPRNWRPNDRTNKREGAAAPLHIRMGEGVHAV